MSEILTRVEVDCETGVSKIIPLTPAEIAELQERQAAAAAELEARAKAEADAAKAREALLKKLGITAEEAALLLG
jgi:hypothetical protein